MTKYSTPASTTITTCRRRVTNTVGSDVLYRGEEGWLRRRFREEIIKFVARRADVINTVSAEFDEELIRLGVSKSKLLRIPFGVDLEAYHPSEDMPRPTATRFICTRKHGPSYDIPTIIEALGLLKEAGVFKQLIAGKVPPFQV